MDRIGEDDRVRGDKGVFEEVGEVRGNMLDWIGLDWVELNCVALYRIKLEDLIDRYHIQNHRFQPRL